MRLELSIKDDKELRNVIKDNIKGLVTSVVRDEIKETVDKVLTARVKNKQNEQWVERRILNVIEKYIYKIAEHMTLDLIGWNNKIEKVIQTKIDLALDTKLAKILDDKDYTKQIEILAEEKILKLLRSK